MTLPYCAPFSPNDSDSGVLNDHLGRRVQVAAILDHGGAVFNVCHPNFGARGDGVTDDTAAIQAAIGPNRTVYLPEGTFLITKLTIDGVAGLRIVGAGRDATVLKIADGANPNPALDIGPTADAARFYLADLTIDGNKTNQTANGRLVSLGHNSDAVIERVRLHDGKERGISGSLFGTSRAVCRDVIVESCDDWGVSVNLPGVLQWFGGRLSNNTAGGFRATGGGAGRVSVEGALAQTNGGPGVECNAVALGLVVGCICIGNGGVDIHGAASAVFMAVGNHVDGTGGSSNGIDSGSATIAVIVGNTSINASAGAEQRGIDCAGATAGLVADNYCAYNGHQGILVGDSSNVTVVGNVCRNNGQAGAQADGIKVWALTADAVEIVVEGNRCYDDQGVATQQNGVRVETAGAGLTARCALYDNIVVGNGVNGVSSGGAGTESLTRRGNVATTGPSQGRAVLVAGSVVVNTPEVASADNILLTSVSPGGAPGAVRVSAIAPGVSFTITSTSGTDTSTVFWQIVH